MGEKTQQRGPRTPSEAAPGPAEARGPLCCVSTPRVKRGPSRVSTLLKAAGVGSHSSTATLCPPAKGTDRGWPEMGLRSQGGQRQGTAVDLLSSPPFGHCW